MLHLHAQINSKVKGYDTHFMEMSYDITYSLSISGYNSFKAEQYYQI